MPSVREVTLADKQVTFSLQGVADSDFEIEYGPQGFTQGGGTSVNFTGFTTNFTVTAYGTYDVYYRSKCHNGGVSDWNGPRSVVVDGGTSSCWIPVALNMNTYLSPYRFEWEQYNGNFFDVEYGPTGFTIGNGTRIRTNNEFTDDAILHAGITYDFYVRANCGGSTFSSWGGPYSVYAAADQNINVPCTQPTSLYAYKINANEVNYTATGHGNVSYEIAFSQSNTTITNNIIETSSPNGTVGNPGGFSGTYFFWIRGKCVNGSFTTWAISQVQ